MYGILCQILYNLHLILNFDKLPLFDEPTYLSIQELDLSGNFLGDTYDDLNQHTSSENHRHPDHRQTPHHTRPDQQHMTTV